MVKGMRNCKTDRKLISEQKKTKRRSHTPKRTFQNNRKFLNIIKNLEITDKSLGPSVTELIDSLDAPLINNQNPEYKKIFQIPFSSNITKREFYKYFMHGINFARSTYEEKSLKIIKRILTIIKNMSTNNSDDDEFGVSGNSDKLYKVFKMDLILILISNENKIKLLEIQDIADTEKVFKTTCDYILLNDPNFFNSGNIIPYNNNVGGVCSFNIFETLLYSPVIINTYKDVLMDLYKIQAKDELIKKTLKNFLSTHDIFFIWMDSSIYGMILFNGTILINKNFANNFWKNESAFQIFYTLFHELMLALSMILRGDNNFFIATDKFLKNKGMNIVEESGHLFDHKILLSALINPEITEFEAAYLLDPKNYFNSKNANEFKTKFIDFRKKFWQKISLLPTFHIGKTIKSNTFRIRIGCYLGKFRKFK